MQRDLNDTLIFVKVVEHGSLTAAARAFGIPKTTVSRKLRSLEERLGARLLTRTTRRLALTEAGKVYYEHGREVAAGLEAAEYAVHQLEGSPRGWLRVTAPYSLSTALLAPILHAFRERHPDVRVDLVLSNDRLDLVVGQIDVALRVGALPDSTLVARRLATWSTQVYAGEGYLKRFGEPLLPEDLQDHHVLTMARYRRNQGFAWPLSDGARQQEFEVRPVMVSNEPEVLLTLLAADQGLMLASRTMVHHYLQTTNVRRVLGAWRGADIELNAVYVGGRALSPKVRAFVDFVAGHMSLQTLSDGGGVDAANADAAQATHRQGA